MQEKQKENSCFHPTEPEVSPVRLLFPKFRAGTGTEEALLWSSGERRTVLQEGNSEPPRVLPSKTQTGVVAL